MPLWIKSVVHEWAVAYDKMVCPVEDDIKKGEELLGILEGEPRGVKFFTEILEKDLFRIALAHTKMHEDKEAHSTADCDKVRHEISGLVEKINLLSELFWIEVKHAIPEAARAEDGIGLRKGWQIVAMPARKEDSLLHLLDKLSGGIYVAETKKKGNGSSQ